MSFSKITEFVEKNKLINPSETIILGLSGGPDSVYLFCFLLWLQKKIPFTFIAAHLDHEWRTNSAQDVTLCKTLCKKHAIPFFSAKISQLTIKVKKTGSTEDQSRQCRRFFFEQLKKKHKANAIALAHTKDDQLETFFIRLIRGTTVSGLACMRPHDDDYIRPLLQVSKKEILTYLKRNKIAYITDPTNVSPKFLRNRIRLDLIPILRKIDPRSESNILKTVTSMQETDDFLETLAKKTLQEICIEKNGTQQVNLKQFLSFEPFLQRRVLLEWLYQSKVPFTISTGLIEEIIRFLKNKKSTTHQFDTWQIKKIHGMFFIL